MTRALTNGSQLLLYGALVGAVALAAAQGWLSVRHLTAIQEQTARLEGTRLDAVQLLRVQSDLNQLAAIMDDLASDEGRTIAPSSSQFDQIRRDLTAALAQHATLTSDEQSFLSPPFEQFWKNVDLMFTLARGGHEPEARTQLRLTLQRQHAGLTTTMAYLLLENNEAQRRDVEELQSTVAAFRLQTLALVAGLLLTLAIVIATVGLRCPKASEPSQRFA